MRLDLNLLTALNALLEEGSVGAAADRMHLSPPAMSRTLSRIRRVTGDEILVRTGRTMTPTPYALKIRAEVHELLAQAQALLAPEVAVDLPSLERTFTVQGHDAVMTAIGPRLLDQIRRAAPAVRLRLLPEAARDTLDLRHGRVDLQIGAAAPDEPELTTQAWGKDALVLAFRSGHPLAGGPLTLSGYCAARHLIVSRRGRLQDPVDDLLAAQGRSRSVVASAPSSTAALSFLQQNDLVTIVPRQMCAATLLAFGLRTAELPFSLPASPLIASWHQRYDNDRAHQWLRRLAGEAVIEVLTRSDG